jgi:hypothetical protein
MHVQVKLIGRMGDCKHGRRKDMGRHVSDQVLIVAVGAYLSVIHGRGVLKMVSQAGEIPAGVIEFRVIMV